MSRAIPITALILIGSCSVWTSPVPPGMNPTDVFTNTSDADPRITIEPDRSPGEPERTRPVIYPPRVLAIWVSEHVDAERDMKVGAHWVYVKLRDSSWFEQPIDREPKVESAAELKDDELRRIESLREMVLPWKEDE